jgi:hypothetical protein
MTTKVRIVALAAAVAQCLATSAQANDAERRWEFKPARLPTRVMHGARARRWQNDWDQPFTASCSGGEGFVRQQSVHNNYREVGVITTSRIFPLVLFPFSELFFRQPPIADHASLQILIGHTQFVVL